MSKVASLITFGRSGHTVYWVPAWDERGYVSSPSRTQGYDDPESFVREVRAGKYPNAYWRDNGTPEGDVWVVDYSPNPYAVIDLPLPEPGSWKADRFEQHADSAAMMLIGLSGGFEGLTAYALTRPEWSGLDKVPTLEWVAAAKKAGLRIGRFNGHAITWEEEGE